MLTSDDLNFSRMRHVTWRDVSHLVRFNGHDGGRMAIQGHKLDFISLAVIVNMYDGTNVANHEGVLRPRYD